MLSLIKAAVGGLTGVCRAHGHQQGLLHSHLKVLTAGMKTFEVPPDNRNVVMPEKTKLKFMNKVPNLKKVRREMRQMWDIQGPSQVATDFTNSGQFAIVAMGGGYLHHGHIEMMRISFIRKTNPKTTFARWRIRAPHKPITRKGLGQRMGGGKGAIDHYVTPVRAGRFIVEVGGKCDLQEVERTMTDIAKKLPFPAKVVSRDSLAAMKQERIEKEQNNQNPWTFKQIVRGNMLGIRRILSPRDMQNHGRYSGKFYYPDRL